jgi:hypothetical protein
VQAGIFASGIKKREAFSRRKVGPSQLTGHALQHGEHGIVFGENPADGFGAAYAQRLQFTKKKQPENMVDVWIEQNASGDGRLAKAFAGVEFRVRFDLRAEVGRGSEQKPEMGVGTDGDLGLGAGLSRELSGSKSAAVRAGAIPLRERSSGGRAENLDVHSGSVAAGGAISVFGRILFGGPTPLPPGSIEIIELEENRRKIYWAQSLRGKILETKKLCAVWMSKNQVLNNRMNCR